MSFDSSHLMATVSLVGSALSTGATLYFWLSKVRREQPNLKIYSADRSTEIILGVYRGETRSLQFRTSVVVANYSLLPNAVIAAELAVRRRDRTFEDISAPRVAGLPLNVPSMTTVRIEFEWSAMLPSLASAEELKANQIPVAYLENYYSDPLQIGVSLWALGDTEFRAVLPLRTKRATLEGFALPKPRKRATDLAVYLAVRLLVCVIQGLSLAKARALARGLAWLAYRIDRRHREVARENLRHAFPERSGLAIDELVRRTYLHFCTLLMEIMAAPRKLRSHNWRDSIALVHADRFVDGLLDKRSMFVVTGHFGNWELAGYVLGLLGFRTYAIARRLDNPHLDRFLGRFRRATGQTILDKSGDFERIQQVLSTSGVIATLADQDAGARGPFVEFFGRPASTFKSIALLAMEFDAVMVVAGVPKIADPMRYQIVAEEAIDPRDYADRPDAVIAITQRFTSALERLIRRHPEQYFWLHRRWKHQPVARRAKAA